MPRAGFKRATPATKRPQTYALDRAATGNGHISAYIYWNKIIGVKIIGIMIIATAPMVTDRPNLVPKGIIVFLLHNLLQKSYFTLQACLGLVSKGLSGGNENWNLNPLAPSFTWKNLALKPHVSR
jgi:hypothetical protein